MTAKQIAEKIFYSPATNGKAKQSILDGEKMILEYGQPQMHECKYCGAMTDKPDYTCYKAPKKKQGIAFNRPVTSSALKRAKELYQLLEEEIIIEKNLKLFKQLKNEARKRS